MITFAGDKRLAVVGRAEGAKSKYDNSREWEVSRGTAFLGQSFVKTQVACVIFIINLQL
jgi:hypothetical protein